MRIGRIAAALPLICMVGCDSAPPEDAGVHVASARAQPSDEKEIPGEAVLKSPDGGHVKARLTYSANSDEVALVVEEFDTNGKALRSRRFPCNRSDNAIVEATWLAPERMLVTMHVNPDLCPVMDVNLATGKSWEYFGHHLAFDARLDRVAYIKDPPHFGDGSHARSHVMVAQREICEVPPGSIRRLWWNPEGTILTASLLRTATSSKPHVLLIEFESGGKTWQTWHEQVDK